MSLIDYNRHSHVAIERFIPPITPSSFLSSYTGNAESNIAADNNATNTDIQSNNGTNTSSLWSSSLANWTSVKKLVDRVHRHVFRHATFSDMRTLLIRNNLWNDQVQHYLASVVTSCTSCKASSTPPPNRRVSLSSLNRQINEVVCVDHFHLDSVTLLHAMDTATRYSAAFVVESTSLHEAVLGFESCWLSPFWPTTAVHVDSAFWKGSFLDMLKLYDIELRPVPPNRHQKNMLEARHGPIRSIFIRLCHANPTTSAKILAIRAVRVSNDLYGSDVVSAFEAAKGHTRPVLSTDSPVPLDPELL